jgi:transcriptional regulator with XRE-family HTH domain
MLLIDEYQSYVRARVREFRKDRGWSMSVLGGKVTPPTSSANISRLENGQIPISTDWVYKLAAAFSVSPFDLLPDEAGPLTTEEANLLAAFRQMPPDARRWLIEIATTCPFKVE